jgi:hypothetical protein
VSSAVRAPEKANPGSLPQPLTTIAAVLAGIGVVAFLVGLSSDAQSAWLAFQSNFIFTTMLGCAGLTLASIYAIVDAKWCGPYRRFAEGLAAWVPISFVLTLIGILGGPYLFEWIHAPAEGKEVWLNPTRLYTTDVAIMGVMAILSVLFLRASTRPTLKNLAEQGQGFARNMAQKWTAGWKGDEEEREIAKKRTAKLGAWVCIVFGVGVSLFNFDQVMSMEQMWYSNLFGAFVCWGGILSAVAASTLLGVLYKDQPGFKGQITEARMHDIGKMLFGFSIFWMYLFWSQYLVIYYGNLPEETFFLRDRLGPQFMIDKGYTEHAFALSWNLWDFQWARLAMGYGWISMIVWACCWIIPFWVLLGERPKKTTWIVGPVAAIVLFGLWMERNLLVWPSVVKNDMTSFLGLIPLCIGAGFLGAYVLVFLFYSRIFPSLAVAEDSQA